MEIRRRGPAVVVIAGAVVIVIGSFLPWVASGRAERSSYELLGLLDRLGLADGWTRWAVVLWPAMPFLLAVAVTAMWWGRRIAAITLGSVAGLHAGAVATAVLRAPDDPFVRSLGGTVVTLAGVALLATGLAVEAARPSAREPAPAVGGT